MQQDEARARELRGLTTTAEWIAYHGRSLRESVHALAVAMPGLSEIAAAFFAPEQPPAAPMDDDAFSRHVLYDLPDPEAPESGPLILRATVDGEPISGNLLLLARVFAGSRPSLHEVVECKRGKGVRLRNRLLDDERFVPDAPLAEVVEPLQVICGRVVIYNEKPQLLDGWNFLGFRGRKAAIADLRASLVEGVPEESPAERAAWLKQNAATVHRRARATLVAAQ